MRDYLDELLPAMEAEGEDAVLVLEEAARSPVPKAGTPFPEGIQQRTQSGPEPDPSASAQKTMAEAVKESSRISNLIRSGGTDVFETQTGTAWQTARHSDTPRGEEDVYRHAAVLSGEMARLHRAAGRAEAFSSIKEDAVSAPRFHSVQAEPTDPVLLVDAAFQRDARRYDGKLGLL